MANKDFKVKNGLDISTPLSVEMGGTGQTSSENTLNAILPLQTGNSGKVLSTDGTSPSWTTIDLSAKQNVVANVSDTEIGYLDGVTSAIQTQLDSKSNITKTVSTKTADYTLATTDKNSIIEFNSSSDLNLTLPTYSNAAFSYGDSFSIVNRGTGKVNLVNQTGTLPLTSFSISGNTTSSLNGIAYGNGIFIAAFSTTYYRSTDGITWTTIGQNSGSAVDYKQNSVIFVNGTFYITGSSTIKSSTDGITWTTRATTTANVHSIAYGNGKFIAAGASGNLWTSTDGTTWTAYGQITGFTTSVWYGIVYHTSGIWVLAGNGILAKSSDNGVTWTQASSATNIRGLKSNGSIIVATIMGISSSFLYTSTDAITWTSRSAGSGSRYWSMPYWDGTQFIIATASSTTPITTYTSSDGITWTQQSTISLGASTTRILNIIQNASGSYLLYGDGGVTAYTSGPVATSYVAKNNSTYIPPNSRAEIYNYSQNQFVVSGDLDNAASYAIGNTTSRPGSPVNGQIYSNTETGSLEIYKNNAWTTISPVPNAPTSVSASVSNGTATISFTAPTNVTASSYTATSSSGGYTGTASSSPITISNLGGGTYTFTVTATGSNGISAASSASNSVTVTLPTVTGGTLSSDSTYYYRTFTSSSNLVVSNGTLNADILLVAGGGGASGSLSGGGGAGGLLGLTSQSLSANTYVATVGAGGSGISSGTAAANNGSNSQLGSLTAAVGGGRGGYDYTAGGNGGSGGGSSWLSNPGGSPTSGQGYAGADGNYDGYGGGGGGGAGGVGITAGTNSRGGDGGVGSSAYSSWGSATTTGQNVGGTRYYAGGGGGGESNSGIGGKNWPGGNGGYGGGGKGGGSDSGPSDGTANTGGGGGGGGGNSPNYGGAAGGSGLIIVRYLKTAVA